METKHTPGEWKVIPYNGYQKCIGTDKYTICHTTIALEDKDKVQAEANAKLIAAAPDLLAAALQIKNEIDTEGLLQGSYEKLLEAIEKATK